ncbi:MAG: family 1 glycosylhydrolase, partial [Candidatus Hodarchaeota archaeon]
TAYMMMHLNNISKAIGVDRVEVLGYCWWSFLHGYEWGLDFKPFFALIDVDIGKSYEHTMEKGIPQVAPGMSLIGHIALGDQIVKKAIDEMESFPKDLEKKIRHIILSHHGRKEWDAIVEPQFAEAEIVHYLDMVDSRFKMVND